MATLSSRLTALETACSNCTAKIAVLKGETSGITDLPAGDGLTNLLQNGDFSDCINHWTAVSSVIDCTCCNEQALKVQLNTSATGSAYQEFATTVGHTYEASVYIKLDTALLAGVYIKDVTSGNVIKTSADIDSFTWYKVVLSFIAVGTATRIYLENRSTVNGYIACFKNAIVIDTDGLNTSDLSDPYKGYSGDGGIACLAKLNNPKDAIYATDGKLYIADTGNHVIRVMGTDKIIETFAGDGTPGFSGDNGIATNAQFNLPDEIFFDGNGDMIIVDSGNNAIRKITMATGIVTTIAGICDRGTTYPEGVENDASINLRYMDSMIMDKCGGVYAAMYDFTAGIHRLYYFTKNNAAYYINVSDFTFDPVDISLTGSLLSWFHRTVISNNNVIYGTPYSATFALYAIDIENTIISIAAGITNARYVSHTPEYSWWYDVTETGLLATDVHLENNSDILLDKAQQNIYFRQQYNTTPTPVILCYNISTGWLTKYVDFVTDYGLASDAYVDSMTINSKNDIFVVVRAASYGACERIYKIRYSDKSFTLIAGGTATDGYSGDGGSALDAGIQVDILATDYEDNLYFGQDNGYCIRKINMTTGIITNYAGAGVDAWSHGGPVGYGWIDGDGGLATEAAIGPGYQHICFDKYNNMYFNDRANSNDYNADSGVIRRVDKATGIITSAVGNASNINTLSSVTHLTDMSGLCVSSGTITVPSFTDTSTVVTQQPVVPTVNNLTITLKVLSSSVPVDTKDTVELLHTLSLSNKQSVYNRQATWEFQDLTDVFQIVGVKYTRYVTMVEQYQTYNCKLIIDNGTTQFPYTFDITLIKPPTVYTTSYGTAASVNSAYVEWIDISGAIFVLGDYLE